MRQRRGKKIIRKSLFAETRALDLPQWLVLGEDGVMCLRLAKKLRKAARIPQLVYTYRYNENGMCLSRDRRNEYQTQKFFVDRCALVKNSFVEMNAEWQEVWKIFAIATFSSNYVVSPRKEAQKKDFQPFLEVLRERKKALALSERLCLARAPRWLIRATAFCALLARLGLRGVFNSVARRIYSRVSFLRKK